MPTEVVETKETVPLWLAIAITVCVSLPFALWLGRWNIPIWASFIVWAEYFALGAKWQVLLKIAPAYISGVLVAAVVMTFYVWLTKALGTTQIFKPTDLALTIACFVGFCVFIFVMKYIPMWSENTLPFFNGVSMGLAVYFTSAFIHPFSPTVSPYLLPAIAALGAILAGALGGFLGWFNVTIMFPRPVRSLPTEGPIPAIPAIPAIPEQPLAPLSEFSPVASDEIGRPEVML